MLKKLATVLESRTPLKTNWRSGEQQTPSIIETEMRIGFTNTIMNKLDNK